MNETLEGKRLRRGNHCEPVDGRGSFRRRTKYLYVVLLTAVSLGMWTVMVLVFAYDLLHLFPRGGRFMADRQES